MIEASAIELVEVLRAREESRCDLGMLLTIAAFSWILFNLLSGNALLS